MKRSFTTFCLAVAFVLTASVVRAQVDCPVIGGSEPPVPKNEGQEFLVCFMANERPSYDNNQYQDIYIASLDKAAKVYFKCPALLIDDSVQIGGFGSFTYRIPIDSLRPQGALIYSTEAVDSSCIYVSSTAPIICYGMNHKLFSADAFLALPRHTAGQHHMVISYANSYITIPPSDRPSEFAVAAWQDSTVVTIKPTAATSGGVDAGEEFKILLNKHEAVQIQAVSTTPLLDLTGSIVTSSKPVAVWGGHERAEIPVGYEPPGSNTTSRDHLAEQLPPTNTWGTKFVASNFFRGSDSGGIYSDLLRVLALNNGTTVTINNIPVTTLNSGKFFDTLISAPVLIETSDPALVGMYAHTSHEEMGIGDPFLAIVPPIDQFYKEFTFFISSDTSAYSDHHLLIITERSGPAAGIFLDGVRIPDVVFKPIPLTLNNMSFSIADIVVTSGIHRIRTNNPNERGIVIVAYGWGEVDSYGYTAGSLLKPLQGIIPGDAPKAGIPRGAKPEPKVWLRSIIKERVYFDKATITLDENTSKVYDVQLKKNIMLDTRFIEGGENKGLDLVISPLNDEPVRGTIKVEYHTAKYRDLRPATIPFTIEPQLSLDVKSDDPANALSVDITPNPVTSSTANITITPSEASGVIIRLIDATGREVFKSAKARISAAETFQVDTRKLAAGVYTCEVATGGLTERKQLVVVR